MLDLVRPTSRAERLRRLLVYTIERLEDAKGAGVSALVGKVDDLAERYHTAVTEEAHDPSPARAPREICRRVLAPDRVGRMLAILGVPRDHRDTILAALHAGLRAAP